MIRLPFIFLYLCSIGDKQPLRRPIMNHCYYIFKVNWKQCTCNRSKQLHELPIFGQLELRDMQITFQIIIFAMKVMTPVIMLWMRSPNKRGRLIVTRPLSGWVHNEGDHWTLHWRKWPTAIRFQNVKWTWYIDFTTCALSSYIFTIAI